MRDIETIKQDLAEAEADYDKFLSRVGDDMGCDGTHEQARSMLDDIGRLEQELKVAETPPSAAGFMVELKNQIWDDEDAYGWSCSV